MNKVVSLDQKRKEISNEKEFIGLLDKDIDNGNIEEIPSSVFDRIAAIKHKALIARERQDLLEM